MRFSPEEIESKEFLTTLRGFDKDEVRAFLRAVADEYSEALNQLESTPPGLEPETSPATTKRSISDEETAAVARRTRLQEEIKALEAKKVEYQRALRKVERLMRQARDHLAPPEDAGGH